MNHQARREAVLERMPRGSMAILYSGVEVHVSADEYAPFQGNRNFFYLTGLRRENMALVMDKTGERASVTLFIEPANPDAERWYGRKVTVEEARETSGLQDVQFIQDLDAAIDRKMVREDVEQVYFDTYRHSQGDQPDHNNRKALEFAANYPGTPVRSLFPLVAAGRMWKDADEVAVTREAIRLTKEGLENVLAHLRPGMKEYQAQADFEYTVQFLGADGMAFPTIAGSGPNGTMLHYGTNRDCCEDGSLLLLDLGARVDGYCADITRTYPVNGKFTDRQRRVYQAVLKANREIASMAKPGLTFRDLQVRCSEILAQGCMELGLIKDPSEIGKYYMHGVSHPLGIDVHDVSGRDGSVLKPGMVITDEPGLYIDEWEIGIRIEDDLLITETGCEVLSEGVLRDPDEIEAFMGKDRNNL